MWSRKRTAGKICSRGPGWRRSKIGKDQFMCAPQLPSSTYLNGLLGALHQQSDQPRTFHIPVFVSHSWSYPQHYDTIADWLFGNRWQSNGNPIAFADASVPKSNPIHYAPNEGTLRVAIYERIAAASVVIIPTGMYSSHSKWIRKEIDGAHLFGKPILAVNPWGQERKCSVVVEASRLHVGWNKQSVVNGIWRLSGHG